jgi:hypothetical protein
LEEAETGRPLTASAETQARRRFFPLAAGGKSEWETAVKRRLGVGTSVRGSVLRGFASPRRSASPRPWRPFALFAQSRLGRGEFRQLASRRAHRSGCLVRA